MKKNYVMLNAFRLNDGEGGDTPSSFDSFLAPDCGLLKTYDLGSGYPFAARLYVSDKIEKEPPWAGYLRTGFKQLPEQLNIKTNSALLIVALAHKGKKIRFAFSFGFGRHFLNPSSYSRDYGVKVALNAIYRGIPKGGGASTDLIQSLDIKTVSENTIHTRRQSNRKAVFEMFGVDIQRDILRSITGQPSSDKEWGTRISGGDAVTVTCSVDFKDLGDRCKLIEELYKRTDYRDFLSWIDHIRPVTNPSLKANLESELIARLVDSRADLGNLELAPPAIVDWDLIKCFSFSFDPEHTYRELALANFLSALDRKGGRTELTIKQLRSSFRIKALDNNDDILGDWSALQCLSGEFIYQMKTYILEGGEFTVVNDKYMAEVDDYIRSLKEYGGKFPRCEPGWKEDDFNISTGKLPNYVLMHKHTVRLPERTTPIEVCDLLSADLCFIHVKPKFSSSTLSHLFSQGYVSAELFSTNSSFRSEMFKGIRSAVGQKTPKSVIAASLKKLAVRKTQSIDPRDYKVVYAIIGNWGGKGFAEKLPFFSKLNLRRFAQDLRSLGYEVLCKRIQQS